MITLRIFDMNGFLKAVDECHGAVNLLHANGKKTNINKQAGVQYLLFEKFKENKNFLRLNLHIPVTNDYLRIVYATTGGC